MGYTDFTQIDTSNEVKRAVNAGLRKVAAEIPFAVRDTITLSAGTSVYDLNVNFMESGDDAFPFKVWRVTADGDYLYGLARKQVNEFTIPLAYMDAVEYDLLDSSIIINPPTPTGDKIYVEGRGDCTPISHGGSSLNPIPKADRIAVVYWTVALLSRARERDGLAAFYENAYELHRARRLGLVPATGGQ